MERKEDLSILRHSAAHLLAHAVSELFPGTKLTIGPATEEGFFYDCLPIRNFKEEDLPLIEERMREIAQRNLPLTHKEVDKEYARKLYKDNPFKLELIDGIPGNTVGVAEQGEFYDLCRGGHVASTGLIQHFKLTGISGSYWRADKSKQALQRISGTAFFSQEAMLEDEKKKEEAALYDHRRVGKQLDLFSFHEEGTGFPFFHPKGIRVINVLINYMRALRNRYSYEEVKTPAMLSDELWRRSGHYDHYKNNMYFTTIDEHSYAIKPMNCPGAILIYKTRPRSYRELPLRLGEYGHVHRHELSGALHGLMRVRAFTQDDAHLFCRLDQLEQEIINALSMTFTMLADFELSSIFIGVSTRPAKALGVGNDDLWERGTNALKNALNSMKKPFTINEGEGAFYGPKIDIDFQDSLGRRWTCSTVQVDFFQPENFDLSYISSAGTKERPVIIHQTVFGSLERFFAVLLEHHKGTLPFWLSPTQVRILTITDAQMPYAHEVLRALQAAGIRTEVEESSDPISAKIKTAQLDRIPWMCILGKKEAEQRTVTVRLLDGSQKVLSLAELAEQARILNKNISF